MMTEKDSALIRSKGIDPEQIEKQIEYFKSGFPYLPIVKAAVIGDGITRLSPDEIDLLIDAYDKKSKGLTVVKFVPASGAASRMFKEMYAFVNEGKKGKAVEEALANLDKFAFADELGKYTQGAEEKEIIANIVEKGLGYGKLPKGLILFHAYEDGSRTALEEHLVEGAKYALSRDGTVNIHFTVSPEHQSGFAALVDRVLPDYEKRFGVKYNVGYSQQKPKTDTVAVDMNNQPFREKDGTILFRPGGHGALLENLNDIDADVIFIKNIDNVVPDRIKPDTVTYKKALAGVLLSAQEKIFANLKKLDEGVSEDSLSEILKFVQSDLSYKPAEGFNRKSPEEQAIILRSVLDRPLRVCGMVKNEGEPGGGPFWVRNADGSVSLQIAESSQIAPQQKELMHSATHFNPVDLVCAVKNYWGEKFDLMNYLDPETGFISTKSKDGRELKAQELPGLWNGAMANWNTLFVEVPISTFNPVKSVNDLLRPQHQ